MKVKNFALYSLAGLGAYYVASKTVGKLDAEKIKILTEILNTEKDKLNDKKR